MNRFYSSTPHVLLPLTRLVWVVAHGKRAAQFIAASVVVISGELNSRCLLANAAPNVRAGFAARLNSSVGAGKIVPMLRSVCADLSSTFVRGDPAF